MSEKAPDQNAPQEDPKSEALAEVPDLAAEPPEGPAPESEPPAGPRSEAEPPVKAEADPPKLLSEQEIASMAATSRLRPFGPRKAEQAALEETDGLEGAIAPPSLSPTVHNEASSVASLDLQPPGGAPPKSGNALARGAAAAFSGLVRLWKKIPPIEDIFDMLLAAMGFQRKPASMLRRAQALAAKGRHAEAIKWFRDILYLRPLTIAAYDGLGRVYFRMGLVEEANREFTIADSLERLVNNRDDLDAACSLAKALMDRKQAKMAVSLLEPVLIAHFYAPNNSDLLKRMGLLYADLRATKKLHQVYEAGVVQHPDDHEFFILKGNLEVKLGRVAEGERLIRWGRLMGRLKENPSDVNANMAFGEMCLKEGKTAEGLDYLRMAATLSPENTGIRWRLFNLYQKAGNYDEALRYFLEVVAIDPDNEELKYKLADFYRKNRHYDQALDIYKSLADKHPRDPRPRSVMSNLLGELGQFDESQSLKTLADTLAIGL
ncbi:MAG: tetratricopeptide repeat protein, partial [Deltaproteobacteria bacterium]|nr:tetratricopeptide repeat protein [Deltaproteobacteria bacterium]